jgi:hypothetical protein
MSAAKGTRRPRGRAGTRPPTRRRRAGRATNGCLLTALLIPYYLIRYYVPAAAPTVQRPSGIGRSVPRFAIGAGGSARPEGRPSVNPADVDANLGGLGRPTNEVGHG